MLESGYIINDTYKIIECIGEGGGGIVYKAQHLRMNKKVVLKHLKNNVRSVISDRAELDVMKNLKHECLPVVLDIFQYNDDAFTVVEYIEGYNLRQLIDLGKQFSFDDVQKYMFQLCDVVEYLHKQHPPVVHGDIKPDNIIITPQDKICLIDFNASVHLDDGQAAAIGGIGISGTDEQETTFLLSDTSESDETIRYIDSSCDIYGIASSVCYMLTGKMSEAGISALKSKKIPSNTRKGLISVLEAGSNDGCKTVEEFKQIISGKKSRPCHLPAIIASIISAVVIICGVLGINVANGNIMLEQKDSINIQGKTYSTELVDLDLSNMRLSNNDILELKYMKNLETLHLDNNFISDISPLKKVKTLKNLYLHNNQISDSSQFNGMTQLWALGLDNNNISDVKPFGKMKKLNYLSLSNNKITDISALSSLKNLNELYLWRNTIEDLTPLTELTDINILYVNDNPYSKSSLNDLFAALQNSRIVY